MTPDILVISTHVWWLYESTATDKYSSPSSMQNPSTLTHALVTAFQYYYCRDLQNMHWWEVYVSIQNVNLKRLTCFDMGKFNEKNYIYHDSFVCCKFAHPVDWANVLSVCFEWCKLSQSEMLGAGVKRKKTVGAGHARESGCVGFSSGRNRS